MAPTELSWAEKITKHDNGIIAATATKEELGEYVTTKVYIHMQEEFTDYTLWTVFQEEFEGFAADDFKRMHTDTRAQLRTHLLQRGVYVAKHSNRVTISERLFEAIQREEQHQWTDEDIKTTIKELAEPLITVALRDRLNHTCDGLLGQPTAIVAIPTPRIPQPTAAPIPQQAAPIAIPITAPLTTPIAAPAAPAGTTKDRLNHTLDGLAIGPESAQPIATATKLPGTQPTATATTPPGTQTPTLMTPRQPVASIPQQPAQQLLPAATASTFPPASAPTPPGTSTPPGPPPARYLHPSTARDRLNHTLNGLAIGPESVQPTTTTTIPPGMQLPTPTAPQLPAPTVPQPPTPRIPQPPTLSGPPLAQYLHPGTTNTAPAIIPPRTQIPTPRTPQPPVASIPQRTAPTASAFPPATAPTPPPAAPPIPPATPIAAPPVTPTAAPPATPTAVPLVVPIAAPPATPIAAPAAPATPPSPQSSNYDQLLRSREQQLQQPQQPQQLYRHTLPEPAVPGVEQGPRQGPGYSKEVATIAKIHTDFRTNRILTNKLVTACQGVSVEAHNPIGVG